MADIWQQRRSSLPDSLLFAGGEQDKLQPIEDSRKGTTARWLHPQADASPMPWGASSAASDRSSIISKTNEKRRRSSMLSNPDSMLSLDDLSQPPGMISKSHKRTSSEGNLRGYSPIQSQPAFLPLSPRPLKRLARLEVGREPSPPLSITDSNPPTPLFHHIRNNSFGALQPWEEGDSLDDATGPSQASQTSASRFAEANRVPFNANPTISSAGLPADDVLRRHSGIVGLGEGWAGGPQRDSKGKKVKLSKIAAEDPLTLWRQEPVAGPSHVGLKSTSMRSFWGKSMQNLGFARSTTALPKSTMESWDADARQTPESAGNKARKMLLRMSGQRRRSRKTDREVKELRRRSLHALQPSTVPEHRAIATHPLTSASAPSLVSSSDETYYSRHRQTHSPPHSVGFNIPQRNSSLERSRSTSSHPFLNPAMRVNNIPGGLPPSQRGRLNATFQPPTVKEVDEDSVVSPYGKLRPASAVYAPSVAMVPSIARHSSLRHNSNKDIHDIASEIALQDARERDSLARSAVKYVALEEPVRVKPEQKPVGLQRKRSVLNRLFDRLSTPSPSSNATASGTSSAQNTDTFTSRSTSRASSRLTHGNTPSITSSTSSSKPSWSSKFKRTPGVKAKSPSKGNEAPTPRPNSFLDGLRSPSMLFLPSQRKSTEVPPTSTPDSTDYQLARTVVEEMLSVPSSAPVQGSDASPSAVSSADKDVESVAAHRLSVLSERDGESEMDVDTSDDIRKSTPFLEVDLGESGLGLSPNRSYSPLASLKSSPKEKWQPTVPVDLVNICKATSSADDLSTIADIKLSFPLPPSSPDVDSFEELKTPRDTAFASSLKNTPTFPVPPRKHSNTSERRISEGYRDLLNKHRPSDTITVFSMLSDEGSDLEYAETHQAYLRPAPRSPLEGVHCLPIYVKPAPVRPAVALV